MGMNYGYKAGYIWNILGKLRWSQGFLRCFRDPIRVPRIGNRVPRIRENRVPTNRENRSLQVHTGYLTFSLKKPEKVIAT